MAYSPRIEYYPKTKRTPKSVKESIVGGTINACINTPVDIKAITTGVVVKVPVVLAELTLRINVNSIIKLPEFACEFKDIRKNVKVTQCFLLRETGKLFIKGFVRKNIQYSTRAGSTSKSIYGDIRHCTLDIPFTCTTNIIFNGTPPTPVIDNTTNEFVYSIKDDVMGEDFGTKDKILTTDLTEFNQISTEFFNELPYCELVSATIVELDEALNSIIPPHKKVPIGDSKFETIEDKIVLDLTIKILQNRQVEIGQLAPLVVSD